MAKCMLVVIFRYEPRHANVLMYLQTTHVQTSLWTPATYFEASVSVCKFLIVCTWRARAANAQIRLCGCTGWSEPLILRMLKDAFSFVMFHILIDASWLLHYLWLLLCDTTMKKAKVSKRLKITADDVQENFVSE